MANDKKKYGVYFANLAEYNNGNMIGGWLYPLEYKTFEDFVTAIKKVTKNADEIAVHDYDNFPNMGEYPSHESIYKLAHALVESSLKDEIIIKYFNDFYSNDYEELIDEIKKLQINQGINRNYLSDRITSLERWKYMMVGGAIVLGLILGLIPKIFPKIIEMFQ